MYTIDDTYDVRSAFEVVKAEYPFQGGFGESVYYGISAAVSEMAQHIPNFSRQRLLDIGCGPMGKTAVLQKLGFQCFGADDLSDPWHLVGDSIEKIKQFAIQQGITFHHQDRNYSIPFEEGSFDVVTSFAVIEHLHESPRELLNAMGRFSKPGGLLVLTMPNSVNLRKRLSVLTGRTNYPPVDQFYHSVGSWRGHVREYTLDEMTYICVESGFDVLVATTYEHLAQVKLRPPLRQIYLGLGHLLPNTRSTLLVVARRPKAWQPAEYDPDRFHSASIHSVSQTA